MDYKKLLNFLILIDTVNSTVITSVRTNLKSGQELIRSRESRKLFRNPCAKYLRQNRQYVQINVKTMIPDRKMRYKKCMHLFMKKLHQKTSKWFCEEIQVSKVKRLPQKLLSAICLWKFLNWTSFSPTPELLLKNLFFNMNYLFLWCHSNLKRPCP